MLNVFQLQLFIEQNPHWETDWMADREKASSDHKSKQIQIEMQKHKEDVPVKVKKVKKSKKNRKKNKKRKNKSSDSESSTNSENSESDVSEGENNRSIRVTMRNKVKIVPENPTSNWDISHQKQSTKNTGVIGGTPSRVNQVDECVKFKVEKKIKRENEVTNTETKHQPPLPHKTEENNYGTSYFFNKPAADSQANYRTSESQNHEEIKKEVKPVVKETTEVPKPHMGFWTKQQLGYVKPDMKYEKANDTKTERKEELEKKYRRPDSSSSSNRHSKFDKYGRYDYKDDKYRDDKYRDSRRKSPDR